MDTLEAAKILDQTTEANKYCNILLIKIRQIFRTRKINSYEYESLINLLSCNMLLNEDIQKKVKKYIDEESDRQIKHIDIRI